MIIAGATPKLTTSARESSSLPIAEYAFSNLAVNPSRKSNTIAASISHEAVIRLPFNTKIMEINPDIRLRDVIRLGRYFILRKLKRGSVKIKINFSNISKWVKFDSSLSLRMDKFLNVKIAVDFDGTIVEHEYPAIGKEKLFAFRTLKELEKKGVRLILWTFRSGRELDEAVEYCRQNGIEFYAVNKNYPEEEMSDSISRKIDADIFIDDRNLGGFPGWSEVWQILFPFDQQLKEAEKRITSARRNIFKR